ncbi:MAG: oxygen-insensitive NADPH nitroreductase [Tumebacillaceae bacterium]
MNETIDLLLRHRSIRKFKDTPLTKEQTQAIYDAAQMASSSSHVQAYSVVAVTEAEMKKQLAHLVGDQAYVEQCPMFLVWCADLHRLHEACAVQGVEMVQGMENFIVATVDATLAAQNAAVAAESLGLGICYIGGIRNNPQAVTELLQLPSLVYPVYGMCVGVPDQDPEVKPRFATEAVVHENTYKAAKVREEVAAYDRLMHDYYFERTGGKIDATWSERIATKYNEKSRQHMRAFLEARGFQLD